MGDFYTRDPRPSELSDYPLRLQDLAQHPSSPGPCPPGPRHERDHERLLGSLRQDRQTGCTGAPAWPAYDPKTDLQMEFAPEVVVRKPARAAAFDLLTQECRRGR
jgi:hypothetical protein